MYEILKICGFMSGDWTFKSSYDHEIGYKSYLKGDYEYLVK